MNRPEPAEKADAVEMVQLPSYSAARNEGSTSREVQTEPVAEVDENSGKLPDGCASGLSWAPYGQWLELDQKTSCGNSAAAKSLGNFRIVDTAA
ncbi:hypothetical protein pipiens_016787 [Culex pipiens pipiens]|uniref:Uncharacterized protein n=1 Tax=Culex pipiens pipiens TaxID=38569 RepID=A0ABD1CJR3_CULPP